MALPQPLHIFRKDLIHLWPETLFVLLLFVIFGYAAPSAWADSEYLVWITVISLPLKLLMLVSWLVLIARAIQDESLVGDRQFWTSRPYHWANLLAAKAILIVTCIYLPFFIMQCYLLHHVGLYPTLVIPALLHNLLLLTVAIIIPLAAISAVTSTFPRVLLTFIATVILALIVIGILGYYTFLQMHPPNFWNVVYALLIVLPAIALFIQYKTRKTLIARCILAATPLIAVLVVLLTPNNALIGYAYPLSTGPSFTSLADQMPPHPIVGELNKFRDYVTISLPVTVANLDKDTVFRAEGVQTTLTADGTSYTSPYISSPFLQDEFSGERAFAPLTFMVPAKVFDKIHDKPVDVTVRLASDHFKIEKPSTWHATLTPFSVPGNGVCSFPAHSNAFASRMSNGFPICRYALQQPEISFVSAQLAAASCATPAAPPVPGVANVGGASASLPDFDPVVTVPLRFQTGDRNPQHTYVLCPGSELSFVSAQTLPRASLSFTQTHIVLDPFADRFTDTNAAGPRRPGQPQPAPQPAPEP